MTADQEPVKRQYVFEYDVERDEWSVCSTGDDHEIVLSRGDHGFHNLAAWVLEREMFTRYGHNEKWVTAHDSCDDEEVLVYGPAEEIRHRYPKESTNA